MGYRDFTELPVWQAARRYKLAVYQLCKAGPLSRDEDLRGQLRRSVAKPPARISEAYGRFSPADCARLLTQAKAELLESQNHLIDAFDQQYVTEAVRVELHAMAKDVIDQVDAWRDYLLSSDAQRNIKLIRERRMHERKRNRNPNPNPNLNPNQSESE